jgi:hypothetical protein
MRRVGVAVLIVLLAGCTGPVRSFTVYESKAGRTAQAAVSAVQTALLATDAAAAGKAYGRYLSQVLTDAEEDATSAQGTFDGIQPPDDRADRLHGQLDDLLTKAVGGLADLRIAARRGRLAELPAIARPLQKLADQLDAFAKAHA